MLAKYPLSSAAPVTTPIPAKAPPVALPGSEAAELAHLARIVLSKSPADLAAIADGVPSLQANWIEAFTAERARAQAEAEFWTAAIAYLMATARETAANDG